MPNNPPPIVFELSLQLAQANTLIHALAQACPPTLSQTKIKNALQKGAAWLQLPQQTKPTRVRRAKKMLPANSQLFFYYNETLLNQTPTAPSLLADKHHYSVWYKPKGMLSQGSKWTDHTTLARWVETHWQRPCFIVHRLDKATDGLMLLAHSKQMAQHFSQLFEQHLLQKTYQARVVGCFPNEPQSYQQPLNGGKTAITHAQLIEHQTHTSLLSIQIETGRKHQIRQHLALAGFPIIGDRLYGNAQEQDPNLQLTAVRLAITDNPLLEPAVFELPAQYCEYCQI